MRKQCKSKDNEDELQLRKFGFGGRAKMFLLSSPIWVKSRCFSGGGSNFLELLFENWLPLGHSNTFRRSGSALYTQPLPTWLQSGSLMGANVHILLWKRELWLARNSGKWKPISIEIWNTSFVRRSSTASAHNFATKCCCSRSLRKEARFFSEFVPDLELLGENLVPEGFPMLVIAPLKQADLSLPSKGWKRLGRPTLPNRPSKCRLLLAFWKHWSFDYSYLKPSVFSDLLIASLACKTLHLQKPNFGWRVLSSRTEFWKLWNLMQSYSNFAIAQNQNGLEIQLFFSSWRKQRCIPRLLSAELGLRRKWMIIVSEYN